MKKRGSQWTDGNAAKAVVVVVVVVAAVVADVAIAAAFECHSAWRLADTDVSAVVVLADAGRRPCGAASPSI